VLETHTLDRKDLFKGTRRETGKRSEVKVLALPQRLLKTRPQSLPLSSKTLLAKMTPSNTTPPSSIPTVSASTPPSKLRIHAKFLDVEKENKNIKVRPPSNSSLKHRTPPQALVGLAENQTVNCNNSKGETFPPLDSTLQKKLEQAETIVYEDDVDNLFSDSESEDS